MSRLLLIASLAMAAAGLGLENARLDRGLANALSLDRVLALIDFNSTEADDDARAGVASTLEPELTNMEGETFHVSQPGEHLMIGIPVPGSKFNKNDPAHNSLVISADFVQLNSEPNACDDLMIRKVTIQGKRLPAGVKQLEFSVMNDNFNDTSSMGLSLTSVGHTAKSTLSPREFMGAVPEMTFLRPRGEVKLPTRRSWRKRTTMYHGILTLDKGTHTIDLFWATVWRGFGEDGQLRFATELMFTASGFGHLQGSVGLLGSSSHEVEAAPKPGCSKAH